MQSLDFGLIPWIFEILAKVGVHGTQIAPNHMKNNNLSLDLQTNNFPGFWPNSLDFWVIWMKWVFMVLILLQNAWRNTIWPWIWKNACPWILTWFPRFWLNSLDIGNFGWNRCSWYSYCSKMHGETQFDPGYDKMHVPGFWLNSLDFGNFGWNRCSWYSYCSKTDVESQFDLGFERNACPYILA